MTEYYGSTGRLINGERTSLSKLLFGVIFVIITSILVTSTRNYEQQFHQGERKLNQLQNVNLKLKQKLNEIKAKLKAAAKIEQSQIVAFENQHKIDLHTIENLSRDLPTKRIGHSSKTTAIANTVTQASYTVNTSCPIKPIINWTIPVQAKYNLNPTKFITTVTVSGPNNQLIGFRETIFMAIKLNRTIIPPLFFKHGKADPTAANELIIVPNYLRFDISNLRQLITTIPPEEAFTKCDGKFDAIYRVSGNFFKSESRSRLELTCRNFNNSCITGNYTNSAFPSNVRLPVIPDDVPSGRFLGDFSDINNYYTTDAVCPIVAFPYMVINFWSNVPGLPDNEDRQIMRDIVKMTSRPAHIGDLVNKFVEKYLSDHYISIHWRYNEDDWYHGGCTKGKGETKICKQVNAMKNPSQLARSLYDYLEKKHEPTAENLELKRKIPDGINKIYIASPPSEVDLLSAARSHLATISSKYKIYLQSDLIPFVVEHYEKLNCGALGDDLFEILSLVDMEICFRSDVFLSSIGSSWSKNTNMERYIANYRVRDQPNTILFPEAFPEPITAEPSTLPN